MSPITVTEARSTLFNLVDKVADSHDPVLITGRRNNAVLVSENDWRAIKKTLYLLNISGMRESIVEGMNTPIEECDSQVEW